MKKWLSLLLSLAMLAALAAPALAAAPEADTALVTPTPPAWVEEKDYVIFPGDEAYQPENWAKIEALREAAENGALLPPLEGRFWWAEGSPATRYETGLLRLKYAENAGIYTEEGKSAFYAAASAFLATDEALKRADEATRERYDIEKYRNIICLQTYRAYALYNPGQLSHWGYTLLPLLDELDMTFDEFFEGPYMDRLAAESITKIERDIFSRMLSLGREVPPSRVRNIQIFIDGKYLEMDVLPELRNGRTMVPIRAVAEAIGAEVEWVQKDLQIIMTRAGRTVTMTLNSPIATVDGEEVEMDVAPYLVNNRTLVPARYVAEFFGQKVAWSNAQRRVYIDEDKTVAGESNLEAWALPMGAMLAHLNRAEVGRFGEYARTAQTVKLCHSKLDSGSWSIVDRDDLAWTVVSMTLSGHNSTFLQEAAYAMSLSEEDMALLVEESNDMGKYMWPYVKELGEKWGDRGVIAWDLFRMSNLVQWGYTAGYLTYEEALGLLEGAAILLANSFSSWDEAYENYLDGYAWWSRTDVAAWRENNQEVLTKHGDKEGWQEWMFMPRGECYFEMKTSPRTAAIFDDTLFTAGVIGLPE